MKKQRVRLTSREQVYVWFTDDNGVSFMDDVGELIKTTLCSDGTELALIHSKITDELVSYGLEDDYCVLHPVGTGPIMEETIEEQRYE